jgi:hypothetical protein
MNLAKEFHYIVVRRLRKVRGFELFGGWRFYLFSTKGVDCEADTDNNGGTSIEEISTHVCIR